tara:strand:+ start:770 stop:916 length:147 start_codon:yes stop_codon:yes gene_type:complete
MTAKNKKEAKEFINSLATNNLNKYMTDPEYRKKYWNEVHVYPDPPKVN